MAYKRRRNPRAYASAPSSGGADDTWVIIGGLAIVGIWYWWQTSTDAAALVNSAASVLPNNLSVNNLTASPTPSSIATPQNFVAHPATYGSGSAQPSVNVPFSAANSTANQPAQQTTHSPSRLATSNDIDAGVTNVYMPDGGVYAVHNDATFMPLAPIVPAGSTQQASPASTFSPQPLRQPTRVSSPKLLSGLSSLNPSRANLSETFRVEVN